LKFFFSAVVFAIVMFGSAGAGVLITVENRALEGTGPKLVVSKIAIDGKRVRIDHEEADGSGRGSVIYRGDRKQMIVLDHRGNSFQIITQDSMKAMNQQMKTVMKQMESRLAQLPPAQRKMMEQMMQHQMPQAASPPIKPPTTEVRKTGAKKRIKGYPTNQYEVYQNGNRVREMWVADWADAGVIREDFLVFKEMHQFQQKAFASMNRESSLQPNDGAFDEFRQVNGLPVTVTSFKGAVKDRETTLKSLEQRGFDASYFAPPKDYKEDSRFAGPKRSGSPQP
jgi:ABC-type dipeptide/oligopeptide/nickel transport system ATPase component